MASKFAQAYNRFCYRAETRYMLNHLTLGVRDPAIKKEVLEYQTKQIRNLIFTLHFFALLMLAAQINQYFFTDEGHPLRLILSVSNLLFLPAVWALDFVKRKWGLNTHVMLFYMVFFLHASISALISSDFLPEWLSGRKSVFDMQILISYTAIMAVPIHTSYWQAFVLMTPILMVTTYFKSQGEYETLEKFQVHLPEDLQSEFTSRLVEVRSQGIKMLTIACVFCFSHYLSQKQTYTLLIEKQAMQKQSKQLTQFLGSQKDAIVMYKLSNCDSSETSYQEQTT